MVVRRLKDDELYHHGVKGMRWGHRKQRVLVGRRRGRMSDNKEATKPALSKFNKDDAKKRKRVKRVLVIAVDTEATIIGSAFVYDYIKKKKALNSPEVKDSINTGKQFFNSFKSNAPNFDSFKPDSFKPDTFNFETFKPDTFKWR